MVHLNCGVSRRIDAILEEMGLFSEPAKASVLLKAHNLEISFVIAFGGKCLLVLQARTREMF